MAQLTTQEFNRYLNITREKLLRYILSIQHGTPDDGQDALQETHVLAWMNLEGYSTKDTERTDPYPPSLLQWLRGIARHAVLKEQEKRPPATVPIEYAHNIPAPDEPEILAIPIKHAIEQLPENLRVLVAAWHDGYNQLEISKHFQVPYNTTGRRLQLAFQELGKTMPRAGDIEFRMSDFMREYGFMSHATTYSKPQGVWKSWRRSHPSDARLSGRRGRR